MPARQKKGRERGGRKHVEHFTPHDHPTARGTRRRKGLGIPASLQRKIALHFSTNNNQEQIGKIL